MAHYKQYDHIQEKKFIPVHNFYKQILPGASEHTFIISSTTRSVYPRAIPLLLSNHDNFSPEENP